MAGKDELNDLKVALESEKKRLQTLSIQHEELQKQKQALEAQCQELEKKLLESAGLTKVPIKRLDGYVSSRLEIDLDTKAAQTFQDIVNGLRFSNTKLKNGKLCETKKSVVEWLLENVQTVPCK